MKTKSIKFISLLGLIVLSSCSVRTNNSSVLSTKYEVFDSMVHNIETKEGLMVSPFNTILSLRTFCERDDYNIFPLVEEEIQRLHILFDRYNDFVDKRGQDIINLKTINESYGTGEVLTVDQEIIDLLTFSIELSELSGGYFNPTLGELIDTWNYRYEDGAKYVRFSPYCFEDEDPLESDIENAKSRIIPTNELKNYIVLDDENNTVEFKKYNDIDKVTISLGAIAKGYAVEKAKQIIDEFNVSAMVDGGASSSYGIGKNKNPNRDYWLIGLAAPYKTNGSVARLATLRFDNTYSLSVSGDYENSYFIYDENDNKIIRHHILNPFSGYPENHYRIVSLKSDARSDILDGLSTALFNIESIEEIMNIVKNVEDYYDITIEVLLEKEVNRENKKIDVYLTQNYDGHVKEFNETFFNQKHIIEKI